MNELFFKVTIAHKIDLPLSLTEIRDNPTHEMYMADYEEKIINVMYTPAKGFDVDRFIQLMKRKLKKKFDTSLVEYLEKLNLIENDNRAK